MAHKPTLPARRGLPAHGAATRHSRSAVLPGIPVSPQTARAWATPPVERPVLLYWPILAAASTVAFLSVVGVTLLAYRLTSPAPVAGRPPSVTARVPTWEERSRGDAPESETGAARWHEGPATPPPAVRPVARPRAETPVAAPEPETPLPLPLPGPPAPPAPPPPAAAPGCSTGTCGLTPPGGGGGTDRTYGTRVRFVDDPTAAAKLATQHDKLLFVLHVAGNFEDSKFT